MPMSSGEFGDNPYAPPSDAIENTPLPQPRLRSPWLFCLCCLQLVVLAAGIGLEAYQHESIMYSGPVYLLVGLATALLARRKQQQLEMIIGTSAILLVSIVFLLIVINEWSPQESDFPNTIIILAYTVITAPALLVAIVRQQKRVVVDGVQAAEARIEAEG